ncbi:MAG: sigma-54 dependent transcriptional regulator [Acidobacteria bacterium]|jgi:DNA-binding NtrC family response regulator|nr:sigma-54 dependent transcriptional regulator [Acidobacteriota bacterium]
MEQKKRILLVEDDAPLRESVGRFLGQNGFLVSESVDLADASRRLQRETFDLVLLDLTLPDGDGMDILERFARHYPHRIVVLTGTGSIEAAVLAMKKGAHDFLQKPVNPDMLLIALQRVLAYIQARDECRDLKREIGGDAGFDKFVFRSAAMAEVIRTAREYAATPHTVLISGETGTGKELMAQAIHAGSSRRQQPLVSVNCASIPENLAESELFGYKKGAFTGAYADSPGKFLLADHGTILLDEIGELPLSLQAKLLRVLENGELTPLKSKSPVQVDIRILAATNKDLEEEVQQKRFRADLYYRIDQLKIQVPPLRERREDILPLADHFLGIANLVNPGRISGISAEAQRLLARYDWPGNVRDLRNTIFRISASGLSGQIGPEHLPLKLLHPNKAGVPGRQPSLAEISSRHMQDVLSQTDYKYTQAAKILGISRTSLYRKMAELRIRKK